MSTAAPKLHPKEITVTDAQGNLRTYIMHKFDCVTGREIVAKYPISNIPKLGDYAVSEETMLKLMGYVAVQTGDKLTFLSNLPLLWNHVPDWETLTTIEREMVVYNCSFFQNGKGWISLAELSQKAGQWISKISMASLGQLLAEVRQASMNSEQSTPSKTDSSSTNPL